jgi:flagellar L-ring protein precursor FlgH
MYFMDRRSLTVAVILSSTLLTACNGQIEHMGRPPSLSTPGVSNPSAQTIAKENYPTPAPVIEADRQPGSLWRAGSTSFFGDQRAKRVGDILTVNVQIDDQARINNQTTRSRRTQEEAGIGGLFGFEQRLGRWLPDTVNPENLIGVDGRSQSQGNGQIQRREGVSLKIAAVITDVLPNGNFVIRGTQEVRVNFELRELTITGVVRPEDIRRDNTIAHDKIAEARISYGGRGQIQDLQQPRWGQQLLDIISPF